MVIRDFEESHGIVIKVGDKTHPNAIEVIASFSDAIDSALQKIDNLDKSGQALNRISDILSKLGSFEDLEEPKRLNKDQKMLGDYVR